MRRDSLKGDTTICLQVEVPLSEGLERLAKGLTSEGKGRQSKLTVVLALN